MIRLQGLHLWISPVEDLTGFARRYIGLACVVALLGVMISLLSDWVGSDFLWSLMATKDQLPLCNFSVVARLIFALSVAAELLAISALLVMAFRRRTYRRLRRSDDTSQRLRHFTAVGAGKGIAAGAGMLFLHLGLYAIAFHADDVCASTHLGSWLRHYMALVAFTLLYSLGAIALIGLVMIALKPALLAAEG